MHDERDAVQFQHRAVRAASDAVLPQAVQVGLHLGPAQLHVGGVVVAVCGGVVADVGQDGALGNTCTISG